MSEPVPPTEPFGGWQPELPRSRDVSRRIGPWRLLERIGRGSQGTVWRAANANDGRNAAVKLLSTLRPDAAGDTTVRDALTLALRRFQREAEVARHLDHPGICPVFEAGVTDETPWIAMAYLHGRTLADHIRATAAEDVLDSAGIDIRLALIESVAEALHAAHEAGVVHRDMKPSNIMVTVEGQPVVLDFGLAGWIDADRDRITRTGDVFGTPTYMAPEQLTGGRGDRRIDVYALGVTLFRCLTLRLPFEGGSRLQLFQDIARTSAPDPRRFNPVVPAGVAAILRQALEKVPDRRYPTAQALASDLRRARAGRRPRAASAGLRRLWPFRG